ncbi:MAG: hypothetical protein K940chlam1_00710 [Candidatus Anoxychlamydiales bacterium]|nr:hypothetical protein [Candidatus Anoxychlamydiales bacterium]NGX36177.1 hypothetical protein [Candidatus Anoxychlamydiales bacterium]
MDQGTWHLITDEIKSAIFFFIAMLVTSGIAFYKNFYRLENDEKINVKFSYFAIIFIIYFLTSYGTGAVSSLLFKKYINSTNFVSFYVLINFLSGILLLIFLYLFCFKRQKETTYQIIKRKSLGSRSVGFDALIGIASWLLIFPIVSFFASILDVFIFVVFKVRKIPEQMAIDFIKSTMSHPFLFIIALISIIIIAPILEEFLFRGVLQNFLKKYLKRSYAILLTSVIFAFAHYSYAQKLANITILGSLFVLAVFLGFLYEKQKSLISPIFLHATFNTISLLNLIFIKGI